MDYVSNDKMKIFLKGVGIGITRSVLSDLSRRTTGKQLGYSSISIESIFKVGIATRFSTLGFLAAYDYMEKGGGNKT